MIYDLSNPLQKEKAISKFEYLLSNQKKIDLTEKRKKRGLSHNNYCHLCLAQYAFEYGDSIEYVKQEVWKKQLCPEIFKSTFINNKTGEERILWRSSSKLDSKEMAMAIKRLRDSASIDLGVYISTPDDLVWQDEIKNLIEENKEYL